MQVRQKLEMSLFFFLLLSLTSFIFVAALVGATALQGHPIYSSLTLGFDVNTGLFGWATAQRIAPVSAPSQSARTSH